MKKAIGVLITILVIISAVAGYYMLNEYAKEKAEKSIHKFLKEANMENNFTYKSLKAHPFSKSINLYGVVWIIESHGRTKGKIEIKKFTISRSSKHSFAGNFENAVFVNLDEKAPEELFDKPILNVGEGYFSLKKDDRITTTTFDAKKIVLDKKLLELLKSKENNEASKIFNLDSPLSLSIKVEADENNNTFNLKRYTIIWQKNIVLNYSMDLANVDIEGFKHIRENLKKQPNNPLIILNYFSKLYQIKPLKIELSIKNLGLVSRLIDYLLKEEKISKQDFLKQVDLELSRTPVKQFKKPILKFLSGERNTLIIKLENKNKSTIGDIIQALQTQRLPDVISITIENREVNK